MTGESEIRVCTGKDKGDKISGKFDFGRNFAEKYNISNYEILDSNLTEAFEFLLCSVGNL